MAIRTKFLIGLLFSAVCAFAQDGFPSNGNGLPQATFAAAPSPTLGATYLFTDASAAGVCGGGGTANSICRGTGSGWAATGGTSVGLGDPGSNGVVTRNGSGTSLPAGAADVAALKNCVGAGTANAQTCNLSPVITSYTAGAIYWWKQSTANTGSMTVAFNGLAALTVQKNVSGTLTNLAANDIATGQWAGCVFISGTTCVLVNPPGTLVDLVSTQTLTNKTLDGVSPATMAFVDPTSSVQTQLNAKEATANKNVANGYAPLDASSLVPLANIPTPLTGKNAATATALAANGTNCNAGNAAAGVDASGNAETCTRYPQLFLGTASPGSVAGNLPGDVFSDTTNHNAYWCNAASGTAAPACTAVATGGWTLLNGGGGGGGTVTLTGDVTGSGTGSFATTIANAAVSLAKMSNLAANSIIGNNTGSPATPIALTTAQTKSLLAIACADLTNASALCSAVSPLSRANGGLNSSSAGTGLIRDGSTPTASELSQDVTTAGSNVATVKGINGVPLCNGFTPTNGQALQYTTASAPNPCYTAFTISGGGNISSSGTPTTGAFPKFASTTTIANSNLAENADGSDNASKAITMTTPSAPTYNIGGTTTCDLSQANVCNLGSAIAGNTTIAFSNAHGSGPYWIFGCQDATGGRVLTYPGTFKSVSGLDPTASACSMIGPIVYDGTTNFYGPGTTTAGVLAIGPTGAALGTPGSGNLSCWLDSTDNDVECKDSSGNIYKGFKSGVDANPVTGQLTITTTGCTNQAVTAISARGVGTCTTISNAMLANSSTTVNGQTCTLGSTCTIATSGGGVNAQTVNYTLVSGDTGKVVTMNGSSLTATLPSPAPSSTWYAWIENLNASALTVSRNGLTINGGTSNLTLQQYQWTIVYSDGTNYFAKPPITAGANITLTMTSAQEQIIGAAATGCTPGGSSGDLQKNNGSGGCAASSVNDDGTKIRITEEHDLNNQAETIEIANAGTTGTTLNKVAKLTGAPSTAVIAGTTDTSGEALGIVIAGAGTTGNARIGRLGIGSCVFDGATTAGDVVTVSSTVAGDCHDFGSAMPTDGSTVLGKVLSTNGAGGTYSMTLRPPLPSNGNVMTTAGDIIYGGTSGVPTRLATTTAGKVFIAGTTPSYISYPDVKFIPAANCNNTTAGAGWSIGASGTVTCRAGTNNLGGYISITRTSSSFATFQVIIPEDWDSATNPYIRFQLASTDATNGNTIIPTIQVACYKGDGSTTDDVAANAAHSLSTITLNGNANRFWSTSNVQMNSTDMTGCVAGALMQITVGRSASDTSTNAEFYGATVTFPELLAVQAN